MRENTTPGQNAPKLCVTGTRRNDAPPPKKESERMFHGMCMEPRGTQGSAQSGHGSLRGARNPVTPLPKILDSIDRPRVQLKASAVFTSFQGSVLTYPRASAASARRPAACPSVQRLGWAWCSGKTRKRQERRLESLEPPTRFSKTQSQEHPTSW